MANKVVIIGDSIADGLSKRGVIPGAKSFAVVGASVTAVLAQINKPENEQYIKGAVVALSTGWSNTPTPRTNIETLIVKQIHALKAKGAKAVFVFGVHMRYAHGSPRIQSSFLEQYTHKGTDPNAFIKNIVLSNNASFLGGFDSKRDRLHPDLSWYDQFKWLATTDKVHAEVRDQVEVSSGPDEGERSKEDIKSDPKIVHRRDYQENLDKAWELRGKIKGYINSKGEDYNEVFKYRIDTALRGIATSIYLANSNGLIQLEKMAISPEVKALLEESGNSADVAGFMNRYINSFKGNAIKDIKVPDSKVPLDPTFFIESQSLVNDLEVQQYFEIAHNSAVAEAANAAKVGLIDGLLDTQIETNALAEGEETILGGIINNDIDELKERRYVRLEGPSASKSKSLESTKHLLAPQEKTGQIQADVTGDSQSSTYTGEFPDHIRKVIGSLQASRSDNILAGYPATIRALGDLVARVEGTHKARGGAGYNNYYAHAGTNPKWKHLGVPAILTDKPHPDIRVPAGITSSAAGLWQFMAPSSTAKTWLVVNGGKNAIMSVENQNKGFIALLTQGKVYPAAQRGDMEAIWSVRADKGARIASIWASLPKEKTGKQSYYGQHCPLSFSDLKIAYGHLLKFYQGANLNTGASPIKQQKDVQERHLKANAWVKALNPANLVTNHPPAYKVDVADVKPDTYLEMYNNFVKNQSFNANKYSGLRYVGSITGDRHVFAFDPGDGKGHRGNLVVNLTGINTPDIRSDVKWYYTKKPTFKEDIWNLVRWFNNEKDGSYSRSVTYGKHELFGVEARNGAAALLQFANKHGTMILNVEGITDPRKSNIDQAVIYGSIQIKMQDGKYQDLSTVLLGLGAGVLTAKAPTTPKSVHDVRVAAQKIASKDQSGIYGFKSTALKDIKNGKFQPANSKTPTDNSRSVDFRGATKKPPAPKIIGSDVAAVNASKNTQVLGGKSGSGERLANLPQDAKPAKLAKIATQRATGGTGKCALFVRVAMDKAGYKGTPQGSAYQYATNGELLKRGFVQIPINTPVQIGDIMVYNKHPKITSGGRLHGHIHVFVGNGKWVSDHVNKARMYVSAIKPHEKTMALYRDKNYLSGAKPYTTFLWESYSEMTGGEQISSVIEGGAKTEDELSEYQKKANQIGVFPDLSAYSDSQIRGHDYVNVDFFGKDAEVNKDTVTVFSRILRTEKQSRNLAAPFERGLNQLFPTVVAYVVIGNEDEDFYIDGITLTPSRYYALPPIQSFHLSTNNDFNPLDVCTFSVVNPSGMMSSAHLADQPGFFIGNPEMVNTPIENPYFLRKMRLTAGMKIHVRAGYSNDPNKLVPIFNGLIRDVAGTDDRLIECVCESYASELLTNQLGYAEPVDLAGDHNGSTGLLIAYALMVDNVTHFGAQLGRLSVSIEWLKGIIKLPVNTIFGNAGTSNFAPLQAGHDTGKAIRSIISNAFSWTGGLLFKSESSIVGGVSDEAIQYLPEAEGSYVFKGLFDGGKGRQGDFRDPENKALIAPISGGQFLWNIFNISRANLSMRLFMNVYSDYIEQVHGVYKDTWTARYSRLLDWDIKFLYKYYVYKSSSWSVLKEMEYRHPGTLAKPMLYEERQTPFFGIKEQLYVARDLDPVFMMRAAMQNRFEDASRPYTNMYLNLRQMRLEPVCNYHLLSTKTNILSSNIKLTRNFATKATAVYFESKFMKDSEFTDKKSESVLLSKTLIKHDIRETVVELPGCHGTYLAWLYATQELKKEMEKMYDGAIVVTGNPKIKAGDFAYVHDTEKQITGTIKIRECTHHFSPHDGYITVIKPGLFVEATHFLWDDFFLRATVASSLLASTLEAKQDINLTAGDVVSAYTDMLTTMNSIRNPSIGDIAYLTVGYMAAAGVAFAIGKGLWNVTMKTRFGAGALMGLKNAGEFSYKYSAQISKALGSHAWDVTKSVNTKLGAKLRRWNSRQLAKLAGKSPRNKALVKRVISAQKSILKQATNLGKGITGVTKNRFLGNLMLNIKRSVLGRLAASAAGFVVANPITAIVGTVIVVVAGIALGWGVSAARRANLTHSAISFFPLEKSGEPMVAGINGFSTKGELASAWANFKRNLGTIDKSGKILEEKYRYPNGDGNWATFTGWLLSAAAPVIK